MALKGLDIFKMTPKTNCKELSLIHISAIADVDAADMIMSMSTAMSILMME